MKKTIYHIGLTLVILCPTVFAAGDPVEGEAKAVANGCTGCHGAEGNSTNPIWPKLAGQDYDYMVKQLEDFRAVDREAAIMNNKTATLSDGDIEDLAAFFSSRKMAASTATADSALVAQGEELFQNGRSSAGVTACATCHGSVGTGSPTKGAPRLVDQHSDYLAEQLYQFGSGERSNDAGSVMRNIASKLAPDEMAALGEYLEFYPAPDNRSELVDAGVLGLSASATELQELICRGASRGDDWLYGKLGCDQD